MKNKIACELPDGTSVSYRYVKNETVKAMLDRLSVKFKLESPIYASAGNIKVEPDRLVQQLVEEDIQPLVIQYIKRRIITRSQQDLIVEQSQSQSQSSSKQNQLSDSQEESSSSQPKNIRLKKEMQTNTRKSQDPPPKKKSRKEVEDKQSIQHDHNKNKRSSASLLRDEQAPSFDNKQLLQQFLQFQKLCEAMQENQNHKRGNLDESEQDSSEFSQEIKPKKVKELQKIKSRNKNHKRKTARQQDKSEQDSSESLEGVEIKTGRVKSRTQQKKKKNNLSLEKDPLKNQELLMEIERKKQEEIQRQRSIQLRLLEDELQQQKAREQKFREDLDRQRQEDALKQKENDRRMESQLQQNDLDHKLALERQKLEFQYKLEQERQEIRLQYQGKIDEKDQLEKQLQQKVNREIQERQRRIQEENDRIQREERERIREAKQKEQALLNQCNEERWNNFNITLQNFSRESTTKNGYLDFCFLIDTTGSMDEYRDRAVECVRKAILDVKMSTGRIVRWAYVCYQDFKEKEEKGRYDYQDFTEDAELLMRNLKSVQCTGGDDGAEDLKGAINQAQSLLKWTSRFKVIMIICDAPNHGSKYYEAGAICDSSPKEDMDQEIKDLCQGKYVVVGVNLNSSTRKMFLHMKDIFDQSYAQDRFTIHELKQGSEVQISQAFAELISKASQIATMTNKPNTISILESGEQKENIGGAHTIYQKFGYQFDQDEVFKGSEIKIYEVYVLRFKDHIQDQYLCDNLKDLNPQDHLLTAAKTQWRCKRSEQILANGQIKDVFLMKNLEDNSLYVMKKNIGKNGQTGNYESLVAAQKECMAQMVAQRLLQNFKQEYKQRIGQEPPDINYSELIVLKESEKCYWIAERFHRGEFLKYNNNNGYIRDDNTIKNHFLQAFTYYTLFISCTRLMVCDIQGVYETLTDPAINTSTNKKFDVTDMGHQGQMMFVVPFKQKQIGHEIIKKMNIYI